MRQRKASLSAARNGSRRYHAGDARIDEDRDGLVLSKFVVSYPGNSLQLAHDVNVHFRDALILEPIDLVGDHGNLRLQAQVQPPGQVQAPTQVQPQAPTLSRSGWTATPWNDEHSLGVVGPAR